MAKPFVKWAGGKRGLLPEIEKRIPDKFHTYIEPFAGGGALFFHLLPTKSYLNDLNQDLIQCYLHIKDKYPYILQELLSLQEEYNALDAEDQKRFYYTKRETYNLLPGCLEKSALFIFLNKSCFNGLYRVNKKGQFNVPFGKRKNLNLTDGLDEASKALANANISCADFEAVFETVEVDENCFIFFDSPYVETFVDYQKEGFDDKDHKRLKALFDRLNATGAKIMLTNNCCDYIKNLYSEYDIEEVNVRHSINRNGNGRKANEVIIRNYKK